MYSLTRCVKVSRFGSWDGKNITKSKCHKNCNVTNTKMSLKLKFQLNWNLTKTEKSPKLKCHQNWNVTQKFKILPNWNITWFFQNMTGRLNLTRGAWHWLLCLVFGCWTQTHANLRVLFGITCLDENLCQYCDLYRYTLLHTVSCKDFPWLHLHIPIFVSRTRGNI